MNTFLFLIIIWLCMLVLGRQWGSQHQICVSFQPSIILHNFHIWCTSILLRRREMLCLLKYKWPDSPPIYFPSEDRLGLGKHWVGVDSVFLHSSEVWAKILLRNYLLSLNTILCWQFANLFYKLSFFSQKSKHS